jgi:hypothetical protein
MPALFPEIRVGEPIRFEGLSIFPLYSEGSVPDRAVDYLLSHEAMDQGAVVVTEASDKGSVFELVVENIGDRPVLFLEGAELRGAKQNRAINTTLLVGGQSRTNIPVYCVERQRWSESCGRFRPGSHSPPSMRRVFKEGWVFGRKLGSRPDQNSVWAEVRRKHGALKTFSETEDMSATLETHREKVERMQKLCVYPAPANGIALTLGSDLICIDLLDKGSSLEKIWSRYQEGILVDHLESHRPEREITAAEISARLDQMQHLPWQQVEPIGLGEQYRAHGNSVLAAALVLDGTMIHGSALMPFPR